MAVPGPLCAESRGCVSGESLKMMRTMARFSGYAGGGAVVVPLLALATDLDHKTALGTSLCAMVPTGVAGVLAPRRLGHVRLAAAAPLGRRDPPALIAHRCADAKQLACRARAVFVREAVAVARLSVGGGGV